MAPWVFLKQRKKMQNIELYIHIPFCIRKCRYCDFLSFPCDQEDRDAYLEALIREIEVTGTTVEEEVSSVFIGGGTPSMLPASQMERILTAVREAFTLTKDCEISMESNPGTLTEAKLRAYHQMGINRLSIGLQSTEDALLKRLGRIHNYQQFLENYQAAKEAGFTSLNIDLMSGLPGQTLEMYEETLRKVTALSPQHISAYSLIIEEGTPFAMDPTVEEDLPDEETERQMYAMTDRILKEAGYHRYEISNYAKEGFECRHNKGYWQMVPYIGMGLGAASYYKGARFTNTDDYEKYIAKPFTDYEKRCEYQLLTEKDQIEDFMIFGLRMMEGVSVREFRSRFGKEMKEVYPKVLADYLQMGYLTIENDHLQLTSEGISVSNRIFVDLLL